MTRSLLKRFRKELRSRPDIVPGSRVTLCDDPMRAGNTRAATLLLEDAFKGRVHIDLSPEGIVCGSREEAACLRIASFTAGADLGSEPLLSSLRAEEIREYMDSVHGERVDVFVPDSPERRFLAHVGDEVPDVWYGA